MSEKIVRFSRLLRIFELNGYPAYIIELEENDQKTLYISYKKTNNVFRYFELYNESILKREFKNLSDCCLMSQCINAESLFDDSPITHFEADCSSLVNGYAMFRNSKLRSIKVKFPLLENGNFMFSKTKITEITIDFPKLKSGDFMFYNSSIESITSQFPMLESGEWMFGYANLKEVNCQFRKLKERDGMFTGVSVETQQNYPHYFA